VGGPALANDAERSNVRMHVHRDVHEQSGGHRYEHDEGCDEAVLAGLTERERRVLTLVAAGLSNAEIGSKLFISEKTVRNHLTPIFDKLGVHSRARAIVLARNAGLHGGR